MPASMLSFRSFACVFHYSGYSYLRVHLLFLILLAIVQRWNLKSKTGVLLTYVKVMLLSISALHKEIHSLVASLGKSS